jgi:hypothetical protein
LVASVVGGCGNAPAHDRDLKPGPLGNPGGTAGYALPKDTPEVFTDGFGVIALPGNKPAELLKVESLGGGSTFEFLGAKLAAPEREFSQQQVLAGWPPAGLDAKVYKADGATILPAAKTFNANGYELLLGYRIKSREPAIRTGIRLTYRIGDETFEAVIPAAFAMCASNQSDAECSSEADAAAGE